jgi:hypothetical protein
MKTRRLRVHGSEPRSNRPGILFQVEAPMRMYFLAAVCALLAAPTLEAQIRILAPPTGRGSPDLKSLSVGQELSERIWDEGKFQDAWCTSFLGAEGKAPTPKYPDSDDEVEQMEDNEAYLAWADMYCPLSLLDGRPSTAWVAGGKGIGETVLFPADATKSLQIYNGFQRSESLYKKNSRPQGIRVFVLSALKDAGQYADRYRDLRVIASRDSRLEDRMGPQPLALPDFALPSQAGSEYPKIVTLVAIRILSVYAGTAYTDTCISEVSAP